MTASLYLDGLCVCERIDLLLALREAVRLRASLRGIITMRLHPCR